MTVRDLRSRIKGVKALTPGALRTSTVTGSTVDTYKYQSCVFLVSNGVITDGTHTLSLQDSDDDNTYAAVSAANMQGSFTALTSSSTAGTVQEVGYLGTKRYVQLVSTVTGSPGTGGYYDAVAVLGGAMHGPA